MFAQLWWDYIFFNHLLNSGSCINVTQILSAKFVLNIINIIGLKYFHIFTDICPADNTCPIGIPKYRGVNVPASTLHYFPIILIQKTKVLKCLLKNRFTIFFWEFCFSDTFEISRNYRTPIKRYPIDDPKDVSKMTVQHETFRWAYNCAQNAKTYFYLVIKTVKRRPKRDGSSRDIHMMRKRLPFRHLKYVK